MVLTIGAIGALVATAAGAMAYNAWNGRRWTRIGGIVAFAISALTILLNPLAMVAMAPIAIGAGLLWLPQIGRYFSAWGTIRTAPPFDADGRPTSCTESCRATDETHRDVSR